MSAGFARDGSLTDEDSSVGETLLRGAQHPSRLHKLAIASVCGATLISVGFAAGRWQVQNQTLHGKETIGKSFSYEQFGEDFSAATAGKSWPEIHRIQQEVEAGQGALGAAYAALPPASKLGFNNAVSSSSARGGEGAVPVTESHTHAVRAQEAASATPSTPSMKAQLLEQKESVGPKCSNKESGYDAAVPLGYQKNTANSEKLCQTKPCNFELNAYDRKQCLVATCSTKTTGYPKGYVANPDAATTACKGSVCDFQKDDRDTCLSPQMTCEKGEVKGACTSPLVWATKGKGKDGLCQSTACTKVDVLTCCVATPSCDTGKDVITCDKGKTLSKDKKCPKIECEAGDKSTCCVADTSQQTKKMDCIKGFPDKKDQTCTAGTWDGTAKCTKEKCDKDDLKEGICCKAAKQVCKDGFPKTADQDKCKTTATPKFDPAGKCTGNPCDVKKDLTAGHCCKK